MHLAAGAAWAAEKYYKADVHCRSYGSPHVGDEVFRTFFQQRVATSIRTVHNMDPVPILLAYKLKLQLGTPRVVRSR